VLELGAGLGLCALTAASLLRAEHRDVAAPLVTLTDFNSGLLAAAERCASENALSRLLCVARCDWADEASSADCEARWRGECNAEYFRVKACEAPFIFVIFSNDLTSLVSSIAEPMSVCLK
jgi:hypothetical protein